MEKAIVVVRVFDGGKVPPFRRLAIRRYLPYRTSRTSHFPVADCICWSDGHGNRGDLHKEGGGEELKRESGAVQIFSIAAAQHGPCQ